MIQMIESVFSPLVTQKLWHPSLQAPHIKTCSGCATVDKELVAAPGHNGAHIFSLAYSHIHMVVSNKW
jgi:hypothetical protein